MIFVTVGNHYQGFERLIKKMDEIAGKIDEKVIMQIGYTKYKSKNAEYFDFKSYEEIQELNRKARVVVCHGGAGSIITALEQGTPVIAVPRFRKFREAIDDQQLDIINAMAEEGKINAVYDMDDIKKELEDIAHNPTNIKRDKRLVNALKEYISNLKSN